NDEGEVEPDNAAEPQSFRPGAVLYLKQKASLDAQTVDISSAAFADESFLNDDGELLYDVRDLSTSYDGKKLLFSMRAPEIENADEEDQPTWNIWEYNIESSTLRRIFDSTLNVRAEDGHDISPSYLPGDRILFTSTRQTRAKAVLLNEGKTGYPALDEERNVHAFNLHIMDGDGQNIQQLTFNQSHDLDPILLNNGKVLFSRWDNAGQTRNNGVNLYEINPDGTGLNYLYGRHSHDSGEDGDQVQFLKPKELENGNIA
ncbi:TolB family protein, partial [Oleiphilus sp. HI0086]